MIDVSRLTQRLAVSGKNQIAGVPQGLDAMLLPQIAEALGTRPLIHVANDDQRVSLLAEQIGFFAPGMEIVQFPAWDCLPYDRVSPSADVIARRLATLARLSKPSVGPLIVLTTVNAMLQRVVPRDVITSASLSVRMTVASPVCSMR